MNESKLIFEVQSKADLGLTRIILDEEGFHHIVNGHRDLRSGVMLIHEATANPTHVYTSSYDPRRLQFVSFNVLSKGGRPMNVIVELNEIQGRIITASPKDRISGTIVWDCETGLYASYDRKSDVLYFSKGDSRDSYAVDDSMDERIWLRKHEDDNSPAGVTVFEATKLAKSKKDELTAFVASFLKASPGDVGDRLAALLK